MLFEEVEKRIKSNFNSNFHFNKLPTPEQIWIRTLCEILDKKLSMKTDRHYRISDPNIREVE